MPEPADQNAGAPAEDAGQPRLRRRRDLRRADGSVDDAWTGTMPAVTPDTNSQTDLGAPVTRRTSWAEAAAAADATKPSRAPASAQPAVPASVTGQAASTDVEPPPGTTVEEKSFRRSRPTVADAIAESPMPDFISSPGLFVKEQKPRPVGGLRGALYNLTGGAWNRGPGPKQ